MAVFRIAIIAKREKLLNAPEDLDCPALFTDLVNSFSYDPIYRYSKVYDMIRALGEALLFLILIVLMFLAIPRVVAIIQGIYLKREGGDTRDSEKASTGTGK
ncbi:MAG: hypothetical protein ACNYWU_06215 [Desulfobacterales bacterium]